MAGSTAPLIGGAAGDLTTSVAAALEQTGGDGERLMLALPWYGYAWPTQSAAAGAAVRTGEDVDGPSTANYDVAVRGAREGRSPLRQRAGVGLDGLRDQELLELPRDLATGLVRRPRQLRRQDRVRARTGPRRRGGLGPGMEGAREEMWWALRNQLQPRLDDAPPAGSPALDPATIRGDIDGLDVVRGSASLRLFAADDLDGTGLALVRIGLDDEVDEDGRLVVGRSYPAVDRIEFPLGDEETGGSGVDGPRSIHVQWRDLAGNWSIPVVLEAHVVDPATTVTPADL